MPRLNTKLESEGAEFLVLGQLLLERIPAYKAYTNTAGFDLLATNSASSRSARIQVKSRWRTGAVSFLIKNFDCEFVVAVRLNRGKKGGGVEALPPEYFVLPVKLVKSAHKPGGLAQVYFRHIPNLEKYRNNWQLISDFLNKGSK